MIEDATRPVMESFEMDDDQSAELPEFSMEHSEQPVTLNLKEAAFALGKSMRALERSLTGKWGNKLPDGWTARKAIVDGVEEWQIMPPPGYHIEGLVEQKRSELSKASEVAAREQSIFPSREALTRAASKFSLGKPLELQLLRELAATHKELSEERRAHLEDLKTLAELQSSMRLLETKATETATLKAELLAAQKDLIDLRNQYQEVLQTPWWKRIFR
ncbi:MAG TPA: hypothetical protein V6C89_18080 [Drouetiella sp.]